MIVINSSPAINLTAALGGLGLLAELYGPVIVPWEVFEELKVGEERDSTAERLLSTAGVEVRERPIVIPPLLGNLIDLGEAAVIQTALNERLPTVLIDDLKGRRVAALAGLEVTGSLGVLLQAKRMGRLESVATALECLRDRGTWLHPDLVRKVLRMAGEPVLPSLDDSH